jgi:hypothetical protein
LKGIGGECSICIRQLASHVLQEGDYTDNNLVMAKCKAHKTTDFDPDTKKVCTKGTLGTVIEMDKKGKKDEVAKDDKGKKEKENLALANEVGSQH